MEKFITNHRIAIAKICSLLVDIICVIICAIIFYSFGWIITIIIAIPLLIIDTYFTRKIFRWFQRRII